MKEIDIEEMKVLQMDILSSVQKLCIERGIKFSISSGTLLGCVRHRGYIPWDDDIDIYLLRDDYNKLVKEFPDILDEKYKFVTLERFKKWDTPYGKIYDVRTILKERMNEPYEIGVNIDVFPIDDAPQDELSWLKYDKNRRFWLNIYGMRKNGIKLWNFHSNKYFLKNTFMTFGKIIIRCIPTRFWAMYLSLLSQKYNNRQLSYVFESVFAPNFYHPFKKSIFDNIVLMPFEDREYMAFADYDEYLTKAYGNWRQLPPIEKRVSHHHFKAWWK